MSQVFKDNIFSGKVVFVTGGAGTICRKQTETLVKLGANACIIGRRVEPTEEAAKEIAKVRENAKVIGVGGIDVRQVNQLAKAVDQCVKELGRIDFVICGAAGNFLADFNHLSANAFKSVVDIDLLGSFNTVKACFEQLRLNKGCVLFVSATLHYQGVPFQSHVGAAKAGVDALSNALAVELGPIGIRCNAIAPGAIDNTEGFNRLVTNPSNVDKYIPLQRKGSTSEIADVTAFLFSDAAKYVTGTVIPVDGGMWHLGFPMRDFYPEKLASQLRDKPKL
ncbi:Peroxisomal 2,4-dienoyl-CoA reductase [Komagataella phaffii CBS 7435]|uniref:2,4-dienoyl-CoA reductase [(3E)-enoyl-CoA-producing] n=2 Tax=Komagataella phaffii TaxID=460519 RepID=C4R653_KOMPG|nr:Peroxisomal 2,4-dienoyl-CoA reductase, auxiliary enzyme of fatty acid beta-oxidation [Komagataella phaffii GS115]AOA63888.1 GQ67_04106T0 [Komagataella phaffii]CAH2449138.1 Peroxisomal 2,4-dienoyl-CoA reductase [Komagataella phaffii CBS 7435]AOA69328.1 GQ68_04079T0 [Komagataella phaffii GS115]CAY71039.1 Peroxisomal 2,4-dienoyl-CoA reductase, auxiliary enzyme of fatty acid beta-oxidation [Komagataella phaffii GS115]SCV12166.1 Peroxisomal 2,4-dienoyl-CoA reductase [Komagataella phaffii CBS 743